MGFLSLQSIIPPGTVLAFAGSTAPSGWELCDGRSISRTTYPALFAAIGTSYGTASGSTFNLPDLRWTFLRGRGANISATGSGTAFGSPFTYQATFTNHGFNRNGVRVRLTSGTLSGLTSNTDYYVVVYDSNTLGFHTSRDSAVSGSAILLSGSNSAVITQWEDPDVAARSASTKGAGSGDSAGSFQADELKSHRHSLATDVNETWNGSPGAGGSGSIVTAYSDYTGGSETRPSNISVNYIIKT